MNIQSCRFVDSSDLFKDCSGAWDAFSNSDPDCSWGDNNRTLVSRDFMLTALDNCDAEDESVAVHIAVVMKRLEELPVDVYIDLEN